MADATKDSRADVSNAGAAVTEEVRFAVVMYGGISLCVYMCGITEQLLKMVQATARQTWEGEAFLHDLNKKFDDSDTALDPMWWVYRRAAALRGKGAPTCRFVVDILAGTSAGGLNSMFLGKALANNQKIDALANLWIKEGDIALLVNDRSSEAAGENRLKVFRETPPQSLLNSHRMAQRILEALRGMEGTGLPNAGPKSPLVQRLDLVMTATDLEGIDQSLGVSSDGTITERQHRAQFHFGYDENDSGYAPGQESLRNDFVPLFTPFFTFVARCTSSIVPAFEPMRLDDLRYLADPDKNYAYKPNESAETYAPFFRIYWAGVPALASKGGPGAVAEAKQAFVWRPFGDGGYGDNYPFGPAINEIRSRQQDVTVARKFLYVEPDPDLGVLDAVSASHERPDLFTHLSAMSSVKSTETIRGDIQALRERSWLLERLASIRHAIYEEGTDSFTMPVPPKSIKTATPYQRLCATSATDQFADVLGSAFGFDPHSAYNHAVRYLVKAVRRVGYEETRFDEFLKTFDIDFRLRAIRERLRLVSDHSSPPDRSGLTRAAQLLMQIPRAVRLAAAVVAEEQLGQRVAGVPEDAGGTLRRYRALDIHKHVSATNREVSLDTLTEFIRRLLAHLRRDLPEVEDPRSLRRLSYILLGSGNTGGSRPGDSDTEQESRLTRAKIVLGADTLEEYDERVRPMIDLLVAYIKPVVDEAQRAIDAFDEAAGASSLGKAIKRLPLLDQFMFPVLFGAGAAESSRIDVLRVSPLDCNTLIEDQSVAKTKLAGTGLGHFSGFFRAEWRAEDILWGRLDGAERLICAVLDDDGFERRKLILQAQLVILGFSDDLEHCLERLGFKDPPQKPNSKTPTPSIRVFRKELTELALKKFAEWARKWQAEGTGFGSPWQSSFPFDDMAKLRADALADLFSPARGGV